MLEALASDRYEIGPRIGQGGMATVFEATDRQLDRRVAVKLLADNLAADDDFRRRFEREARLAGRLSHPNVVQVFDVGEDEGRPWIVMELVEGQGLEALLSERGPLDPRQAAGLGAQAAAGLGHAHAAGFVHRDVKPQNLLLREDGTLKVADFGIARAAETTRLTRAGSVLGTGPYMAPEQAAGGDVSAVSDVYALGVVLFELLCGRTPYDAPPPASGSWVEPVPSLRDAEPSVPAELERVVVRCLQPDPALRPGSAAEVRDLLEALDGAPVSPAEPPLPATRRITPPEEPPAAADEAPTAVVAGSAGDAEPPTGDVSPVPAGVSEVRIKRRPDPVHRARSLARGGSAAGSALRAAVRRHRLAALAAALVVAAGAVAALDSGGGAPLPQRPARSHPRPPAGQANEVAPPARAQDPAAQARELAAWLRHHSR